MRLSHDEMEGLKKKYGVDRLWSWSRWNCFHNSPYEYYLKYIRHAKEDRATSIYTTTGGLAHDILEKFYTGQIPFDQMTEEFSDGWLTAYDLAGLKFDRNDDAHDQKIADKYKEDLEHFFRNHKPVTEKLLTEVPVSAKIGDAAFVGYIDAIYKDQEEYHHIIDFKTSSIYKGKKAEQECGQLIVYAVGLMQRGIPMEKIRIGWDFLKYTIVSYPQVSGAVKRREVERALIGEALQSSAKTWLKKSGYGAEEIDTYLKQMLDTNSVDCLPEEVKKLYTFSDCFVYVPLSETFIDEWLNRITTQIQDICLREADYYELKEKGLDEESCSKTFWESEEQVKAQSYYFATLCSYSPNLHLPYKAYLEKLENQRNGEDLFGGLADDKETKQRKSDAEDLSWLDAI